MKRKRSCGDQVDLVDLRAELAGAARGSKASIARVLSVLKAKGQLTDDRIGGPREYAAIVRASTVHGKAKTRYGTVVQRLVLSDDYILEYVHPCAYFYYLSIICDDFCQFINKIVDKAGSQPLHVILYGDEMTPGNPMRPDKGRESWQWSFAILQYPNHLLHSIGGWSHITTLRSKVINGLTGGVPLLAKTILHILFAGAHNFTDGFFVHRPDGGMRMIKGTFMGFLADEKGLKEFCSASKGQAG